MIVYEASSNRNMFDVNIFNIVVAIDEYNKTKRRKRSHGMNNIEKLGRQRI